MNQVRSIVVLIMVLLIFAPTIASSTGTSIDSQNALVSSHITNKSDSHSQRNLQLTYEEREKEEEDDDEQKSKHSFANIADIFMLPVSHHRAFFSFVQARVTPSGTCLYLAERSLRI